MAKLFQMTEKNLVLNTQKGCKIFIKKNVRAWCFSFACWNYIYTCLIVFYNMYLIGIIALKRGKGNVPIDKIHFLLQMTFVWTNKFGSISKNCWCLLIVFDIWWFVCYLEKPELLFWRKWNHNRLLNRKVVISVRNKIWDNSPTFGFLVAWDLNRKSCKSQERVEEFY